MMTQNILQYGEALLRHKCVLIVQIRLAQMRIQIGNSGNAKFTP